MHVCKCMPSLLHVNVSLSARVCQCVCACLRVSVRTRVYVSECESVRLRTAVGCGCVPEQLSKEGRFRGQYGPAQSRPAPGQLASLPTHNIGSTEMCREYRSYDCLHKEPSVPCDYLSVSLVVLVERQQRRGGIRHPWHIRHLPRQFSVFLLASRLGLR